MHCFTLPVLYSNFTVAGQVNLSWPWLFLMLPGTYSSQRKKHPFFQSAAMSTFERGTLYEVLLAFWIASLYRDASFVTSQPACVFYRCRNYKKVPGVGIWWELFYHYGCIIRHLYTAFVSSHSNLHWKLSKGKSQASWAEGVFCTYPEGKHWLNWNWGCALRTFSYNISFQTYLEGRTLQR